MVYVEILALCPSSESRKLCTFQSLDVAQRLIAICLSKTLSIVLKTAFTAHLLLASALFVVHDFGNNHLLGLQVGKEAASAASLLSSWRYKCI